MYKLNDYVMFTTDLTASEIKRGACGWVRGVCGTPHVDLTLYVELDRRSPARVALAGEARKTVYVSQRDVESCSLGERNFDIALMMSEVKELRRHVESAVDNCQRIASLAFASGNSDVEECAGEIENVLDNCPEKLNNKILDTLIKVLNGGSET